VSLRSAPRLGVVPQLVGWFPSAFHRHLPGQPGSYGRRHGRSWGRDTSGPPRPDGIRTSQSCAPADGGARRGRSRTGRACGRGRPSGPSAAASRPHPGPRPQSRRGSWRALATVARTRTPTSTPTREPGMVTRGRIGRWTSTWNATIRRVPLRETVAARILARPLPMRRCSLRVFSWTRTLPRFVFEGADGPVVRVAASAELPPQTRLLLCRAVQRELEGLHGAAVRDCEPSHPTPISWRHQARGRGESGSRERHACRPGTNIAREH
jgi:hypothetical protein